MGFKLAIFAKLRRRKAKKAEEVKATISEPLAVVYGPVVPWPVTTKTPQEMLDAEERFRMDMADAHYALPLPRDIQPHFSTQNLRVINLGNVFRDFKDASEAATIVEHLSRSPDLTLVPSAVECSKTAHEKEENVIEDLPTIETEDKTNTGLEADPEPPVCPSKPTPAPIEDVEPTQERHEDIDNAAPTITEVPQNNVVEQPPLQVAFVPVRPLNIVKKPRYRERRLQMSDFVIICRLGAGGFGVVLLVFDKISRRFYALKIVYKEDLSVEAMALVFEEQRIGRAVAKSGCQWMVGIEGSWEDDRKFYMLMPYAEGGCLAERMHSIDHGALTDIGISSIIPQLVLGLAEMHANRVCNRDIKPENILIFRDGSIKFADFGLSAAFGVPPQHRPWIPSSDSDAQNGECKQRVGHSIVGPGDKVRGQCGTPGYVAPEVYQDRSHGYAADVFSVGCIIYKLICGELPFGGNEGTKAEVAHRYQTLPLHIPEEAPEDVRSLLEGMLDKDARTRLTIADVMRHQIFAKVDWDALRRHPVRDVAREEMFKGVLVEDLEFPSPHIALPRGTDYDRGAEPHPWFWHVGPALQFTRK